MIQKIKEFLTYRKSKKIAKKENEKIMSNILHIVSMLSENTDRIVEFITKLSMEAVGKDGDELIQMVLQETASLLNTEENRIVEILTYLCNMSKEDIQMVLTHSIVETMKRR